MSLLPLSFYLRNDVVEIARDLLGKYLITNIDGVYTSGIITETEAYAGISDRASHAFNNRRTARNEIMYSKGGCAYVYLCYGMHYLFNIVTNEIDIPHAVLIRGIKPVEGIEQMKVRTNKIHNSKNLSNGPGKLTKALGIDMKQNGVSLFNSSIKIEDRKLKINAKEIKVGKRIGVDYAKEDALLPYRFMIEI